MSLPGQTLPTSMEEFLEGIWKQNPVFVMALGMCPALAVTALLAFLSGWGDFVFASVLVPAPDSMKLAVPALYAMAGSQSTPWGYFAAGAVIVIIPTLLVFLYVQKYFESGLMAGGVKG